MLCDWEEKSASQMRRVSVLLVLWISSHLYGADNYALLIGISQYEHPDLNLPEKLLFPEVDAKAFGALLRGNSYEVDLLLGSEATHAAIVKALSRLNTRATPDGVALVGIFGRGRDVLVSTEDAPVYESVFYAYDSRPPSGVTDGYDRSGARVSLLPIPADARVILLNDLVTAIGNARANSRVIVADCSRGISPDDKMVTFGAGFKSATLPDDAAVLLSCSPGENAYEHAEWKHGAFTKAMLDDLQVLSKEGPVGIGGLAYRLNKSVPRLVSQVSRSDRTQTPLVKGNYVDLRIRSLTPMRLSIAPPTPPIQQLPFVTNQFGMKLILIPAGSYGMGSTREDLQTLRELPVLVRQRLTLGPDYAADETPQHMVEISKPFYIGVTEVTQSQWKRVMGTEPWKKTMEVRVQSDAEHPVTFVSWEDARAFCDKLSELDGNQYELPTEAQWEYACRGGTKTLWSFGDSPGLLDVHAWFNMNADDVHQVGLKRANPYGLFDMHGNAIEWCRDVYSEDAYRLRQGTTRDPIVTGDSSLRVLRGGMNSDLTQVRSAKRDYADSKKPFLRVGFRVTRRW